MQTSSGWPRSEENLPERNIKPRDPIWTRRARADLFEDYEYIAQFNPSAAEEFVLDVESKMRAIAELGLTGHSREDLRRSLRAISYRQRIFFFTIDGRQVTVLRVLHGHQNITPDDFIESIP